MTYEQVDKRKEYVRRARASFDRQETDWSDDVHQPTDHAPGGSFALRMVLGLLLFLVFVLADVTDYRVFDYSTSDIAFEIEKEDYTNLEKYVMMLLADQ